MVILHAESSLYCTAMTVSLCHLRRYANDVVIPLLSVSQRLSPCFPSNALTVWLLELTSTLNQQSGEISLSLKATMWLLSTVAARPRACSSCESTQCSFCLRLAASADVALSLKTTNVAPFHVIRVC